MNKSGKIHKNGTSIFVTLSVVIETRKRFSEKPIIAFTNSTVFILDCLFQCLDLKKAHLVSCQEAASQITDICMQGKLLTN